MSGKLGAGAHKKVVEDSSSEEESDRNIRDDREDLSDVEGRGGSESAEGETPHPTSKEEDDLRRMLFLRRIIRCYVIQEMKLTTFTTDVSIRSKWALTCKSIVIDVTIE